MQTLNEEQTILVASRPSLEKALVEIESLKKQLEEVAEQEVWISILSSLLLIRSRNPSQSHRQQLHLL